MDFERELAALNEQPIGQLKRRYAELFGRRAASFNRQWLLRRIAWRLQALAEGDLSQRARRRAHELACDADLRGAAPQPDTAAAAGAQSLPVDRKRDARLPLPGTVLQRSYKGRTIRVEVLTGGFRYEGVVYPSLSAVACAVTGAHWSGYRFFGLAGKGGAR